MNTNVSVIDAPTTTSEADEAERERQFEYAYLIAGAVKRATTDEPYLTYVLESYARSNDPEGARLFSEAVEEMRQFEQDEAEFDGEPRHNKAAARRARIAHDRRALTAVAA